VSTLDGKRIEASGVDPAGPVTQIEAIRLERGARVAGQEPADGVLDALADRVDIDQYELVDDFTGMSGGGVHGGSRSLLMENPGAHPSAAPSR
jgi:hypothetical protein